MKPERKQVFDNVHNFRSVVTPSVALFRLLGVPNLIGKGYLREVALLFMAEQGRSRLARNQSNRTFGVLSDDD
jgi:hypothetical protein